MTNKLLWVIYLLIICSPISLWSQNLIMYVSDAGNFNLPPWQILKFDVTGENGKVFIADHLDWPQDILFLEPDNVVLISNLNTGEIMRFDASTGDYIDQFATGIGGPTRMKIGTDGLLYVLQWSGNGKVWRYRTDGTFVDQFTSVGVSASIGLDWDSEGNLYVSSYDGRFVRKFSPIGADLGKFISSNLAGPTNIWFDDEGDLLVNDYNAGSVKRWDKNGAFKGVFISNVPQCEGVGFLPVGNLLLGIGGTSSVRSYNSAGELVNTIIPSGSLGLLTPNAVVLRQDPISSGIGSPPMFKNRNILTPGTGVVFQISTDLMDTKGPFAEVTNSSGVVVAKIQIKDSVSWDASDLPNGIYFITLPLRDQSIAVQKIVVQR